MAYASVSDTQEQIPLFQISVSSVPSATQVTGFITLCSNEIDSALKSRGLSVPVATPAEFVADLQSLNAMGAAARTWMAAFPAESGVGSGGIGPVLWRQYQNRLTELRKGIGVPVAVAVAEADLSPRSYFTDTNSIGDPDGQTTDAWGDTVFSNPSLRRDRVY